MIMEAKTINLSRVKDPETIKKIVSRVVKMVNVNQIYLTIGEKEHAFKYRFTIITEDMAKRFKERVGEFLNEFFKEYPMYYARFFPLNSVGHETSIGNTFFLNNCTEENLIYSHIKYDKKRLFKKVKFSTFIKRADDILLQEMEKIESFKKGAVLFLEEKKYGQAAFMLHQTMELSFILAERFLMGTSFTGHSINDHQAFIGQANTELGCVFPKQNEKQIQLLNKLDKAYVKSRYRLNYRIKKKQIYKLNKKAGKLISLVEASIDTEIMKCQKNIESFYLDTTKDSLPKATEKENDNKPSTLEKIEELSKENFRKLTPIGGIREGYYLNYFRVYNYLELFETLRSTLNVCILALDEQLDCTLDIRHKELDVKSVLVFAKNLIPFEESLYLDEMRKLMLSEKESEQNERN